MSASSGNTKLPHEGGNWNGGNTKIGDVVESLGVRIGEIIHNTGDHFVFLDEDGNVEWLWDNPPVCLGWASARIVELEAKCAFFRANRPSGLFTTRISKVLAEREAAALSQSQSSGKSVEAPATPQKRSLLGRITDWWNNFLADADQDELTEQQEYEMSTKQPDSLRHELSARRFIAQGLVILCSQGEQKEEAVKKDAETTFIAADNFILQRGREVSLLWMYEKLGTLAMISGGVTSLAFAMAMWKMLPAWPAWSTWKVGSWMPPWAVEWNQLSSEVWQPIVCIGVGGLGAYVSRALAGRDDLPCDANAGKRLHLRKATLRWAVGSVAAGLLYLLLKGEVVKVGRLDTQAGFALPLALAFLAGMSERFLPSIVGRFNDQVADGTKKKTPTTP